MSEQVFDLQPEAPAFDLQPDTLAPDTSPDDAAYHAVSTPAVSPGMQQAQEQRRLADQLQRAPAVAAYMASAPERAALVKDDVPVLTMLSEGVQLGFLDIGTALEANRSAKRPLSPEEEEKLAFAEQVTGAGVPGATTIPRKVAAEIARATPTLGLFLGAAGTGALAGGAVGGPPGAAIGAVAASLGTAYTIGFGPLYRRLKGLVTPENEPLLSDDQAKAWAAAGAGVGAAVQVTVGAPFLKALPGVTPALRKVGLDAAARAAESSIGKAALARLSEYGGHVLAGGLAMAGQSATNAAAVELSKQQNAGDPDWGAITDAAVEGFKTGLMLAPLAAFEPGRAFLHDVGRIRNAHLDAFALNAYRAVTQDLAVTKKNPAEAERIVNSLSPEEGGRVYVAPEHLPPEMHQAVAEVVGPEAIAEARATHGDIGVPLGAYLVQLGEHHQALRQDVRLTSDGMTLREADQVQNGPLARALAEKQQAMNLPDGPERTAAVTVAHEKMLDVVAAQYKGTPAEWNGVLKEPATLNGMGAGLGLPPPEPKAAATLGVDAMRAIAAKKVETMRLGDLAPGRRRLVADNLAKKAAEAGAQVSAAGAEGSPTTPGRALNKLQEIAELERAREANLAMARAEEVAQKASEVDRKFLLRYTQNEARGELGKAGAGHLEAVDRLLSGFELGQGASRTEVARRQAMMQWIAEEQAAGREPVIPDSVMAKLDRFVHWKEFTLPELRDLRSAVESIYHQATLKNTILEKQARVDRAAAKNELAAAAFANVPERAVLPAGSVVGNIERGAAAARQLASGLKRPEVYIRELDGGKVDGPWHRFIHDPIKQGKYAYYDLLNKVTRPLVEAADKMPSADKKRWLETRYQVNGITYDLKAAIAVMANRGNASNEGKMVRGWADPSVARRGLVPWTENTAGEFTRRLKRTDVDMVQRTWDQLESMWPDAAALEKRLTGVEPAKVKPRDFDLWFDKDGNQVEAGAEGAEKVSYRGGYYPVIYDPQFSAQGERGATDAKLAGLFDPAYYRAATPQGHLQARIENFARPVLLSIDALPRKINQAAKDTAMREAMLSVHSLLTDDDLRAVMQRTIGPEGEKVMRSWVLDVANDQVIPDNGSGPWVERANAGKNRFTASLFAWNFAQTLQNLTGVVPAARAVGPLRLASAVKKIAQDRVGTIAWINEQSGEMRSRSLAALPGVADALQDLAQKQGLGARFTEFGLGVFEATDKAVAYPLWLAAYDKASEAGHPHELAVKMAEEKVRLKLMASATEDLPALMRNRVGKMLVPLYGYANNRLNAFFDARTDARARASEGQRFAYAKAIGAVWAVFAAEVVLSDLATGKGPQDLNQDGEMGAGDVAAWLGLRTALAPVYLVPIIGSMAKSMESGRDVTLMPETQIATQVVKAGRATIRIAGRALGDGENTLDDQAFRRDLLEIGLMGAYATGLPASQIRTTTGYLVDDNQPSDNPLQIGLGVAYGKKRPGKLLDLTE